MSKRVLITGGAGFLGSHLSDRLIERGNTVINIDNLYTGDVRNIQHLMDHPNFSFMEHDVCDPLDIECDEIYNLACPASPVHYQAKPLFTLKTSFIGAMNMLELAKKNKARIFQASTSEVYGDPEVHPQQEEYWGHVNPIGLRACYDEGKRSAETLFFEYHRLEGVEIKVVRIFNTYGPRMHPADGRVVSNFIIQALKGEGLTLYGDGEQTRSFCYVDDLINGFLKLMDSPAEITGPVNIGNPNEFTIKELAEHVLKLTGSKSSLTYLPLPSDDPKRRKPDISRAKELLDWEPSILLEEGLAKTIAYFSDRLQSESA